MSNALEINALMPESSVIVMQNGPGVRCLASLNPLHSHLF